jgi:co-chaperonin GroES (HSP10)
MMTLEKRSSVLLSLVVALTMLIAGSDALAGKSTYNGGGGGGIGRLVLDELTGKAGAWQCTYDMVLVERLTKRKEAKDANTGGLYVPEADLPRLHLCQVLSIGPGREEENGSIAPYLDGIKPGTIVIAKHPWGIGPKDEELSDGTKLSYMRSLDIAAVVTGDLVVEEAKA